MRQLPVNHVGALAPIKRRRIFFDGVVGSGEAEPNFGGRGIERISLKKKKAEQALPLMSSASKLTPVPWPVV